MSVVEATHACGLIGFKRVGVACAFVGALGGGGNKRGASTNSTGGGVAQIKPFRRTQPVDKNIGFIGVGHIGHNLVELLLTQSYNVFVWNKTPQKVTYSVAAPTIHGAPHGVVVRAFGLYWAAGIRFESLSAHHCWTRLKEITM